MYKRDSSAYWDLLSRLYDAVFDQCDAYRNALAATRGATLTHSMGSNKQSETVLTEAVFVRQLNRLRDRL